MAGSAKEKSCQDQGGREVMRESAGPHNVKDGAPVASCRERTEEDQHYESSLYSVQFILDHHGRN